MNSSEILNIVSSGSSLVLSILSIGMSVYFFVQSKNTEKSTSEALASIKAQTESLQKINSKWMDRLTRYATEGNPVNEHMVHILTAIRDVPVTVARSIQVPTNQNQINALTNEAILGYIGILYYSSVANVFSQFSLPSLENFDDSDSIHKQIKKTVDASAADVQVMLNILQKVSKSDLDTSSLKHLYDEATSLWIPMVKDSTATYAERQRS